MLIKAALSALPRPRPDTLPPAQKQTQRTVERNHLLAYQRVCGFSSSDTLPVTYPHVLAFDLAMDLMTRIDFPFSVIGLVHIVNRIEQQRPLDASETLALQVKAENLRDHPRGRQFDVVTTVTVDDEPVWHEVSTYLRRERQGTGAREEAKPPAPHAIWRVGTDVGPAYARVSGDHNPIHTSRLGARVLGFPRPIAHGMWSMARSLAALEGRLPGRITVEVEFKLPILLPGKVGFRFHHNEIDLFHPGNGKPYLSGRILS